MSKIPLAVPTYEQFSQRLGPKYYQNMKRLGRECYTLLNANKKLTAQKAHAAVWKSVIDGISNEYGDVIEFHSSVFLEGIHGDNDHLEIRVRVETPTKKGNVEFLWTHEDFSIREYEAAEAGPSYFDFYVPPKAPVNDIDFGPDTTKK